MTVSATTNRQTFAGPYTVPIDFTLKLYEDSDLVLMVSDDTTGVETALTLDTDYTVAIDDPGPGGTITLLDPNDMLAGTTLMVMTSLPYTQAIDLEAGGNMPAEVLEEGLDRSVILIQQLKEQLARTVKLARTSPHSELTLPDPESGKYLAWKTDLSGLSNMALVATAGTLTLSAFAEDILATTDASTLQDLLEISAFVKTLLNDASAAAFLNTLGLDADLLTLSLPASTTITAFAKTLLDDATAAAARETLGVMSAGFISGLGVSHATDTAHDISIAAGYARDATNAYSMTAGALIKRADATWAVGTNQGGMADGEALPTSGTIHLWLIARSDTGVVDAMFNNHATTGLTPTLPAGYDYKRRIASFRTDGSDNIMNGTQRGTGHLRTFTLWSPVLDISANNPGTSAVQAALTVPAGIVVAAFGKVRVKDTGAGSYPVCYLSAETSTDMAPSETAAPLFNTASAADGTTDDAGSFKVESSLTGTVRYRLSASSAENTVYITTEGWEDNL